MSAITARVPHPARIASPDHTPPASPQPLRIAPVTETYTDKSGRQIQLWHDAREGLLAGILTPDKDLVLLGADRIRNGLNPHEDGRQLLARLGSPDLLARDAALIEIGGLLYIRPRVRAAGKNKDSKIADTLNPFADMTRADAARFFSEARIPAGRPGEGEPRFEARGWDPAHGQGQFIDRTTGRKFTVDPGAAGGPGTKYEAPHVDADYQHAPMGCHGRPLDGVKFPLAEDPAYWDGQRDKNAQRAERFAQQLARESQTQTFQETIQRTGLVETYNGTNPEHAIPEHGARSAQIGGVGMRVATITGLTDTLADLLESEHVFLLPSADGRPPFTDDELKQVIRELAVGIFHHGKRPIFSLHFNHDGTLYPVIPPEYANTLVGYIMGMLDYMMKGFLNGGIFTEEFVQSWLERTSASRELSREGRLAAGDTQGDAGKLVDLRRYCAEHIGGELPYLALRELMAIERITETDGTEHKLRSSFRIIADNPIVRADGGFVIGHGFKVEYTIEGTPAFDEHLRDYRARHGRDPDDYRKLVQAYDRMAREIEEMMPKLPLCRDYFQMLGVIHFFTYYFASLKEMQKVPVLDPIRTPRPLTFPRLLPPLPIRHMTTTKVRVTLSEIVRHLADEDQAELRRYVRCVVDGSAQLEEIPLRLKRSLRLAFMACVKPRIEGELPYTADDLRENDFETFTASWLGALVASVRELGRELSRAQATVQRRMEEIAAEERKAGEEIARQKRAAAKSLRAEELKAHRMIEEARRKMAESIEQQRADLERELRHYRVPAGMVLDKQATRRRFEQAAQEHRAAREQDLQRATRQLEEALDGERRRIRRAYEHATTEVRRQVDTIWAGLEEAKARVEQLEAKRRNPLRYPEITDNVASETEISSTVLRREPQLPSGAAGATPYQEYHVVGGCGMRLAAQSPQQDPVASQALRHASAPLRRAPYESLQRVDHAGTTYFAFKLPVMSYVAPTDDDYAWLDRSLVADPEHAMTEQGWAVAAAVMAGDAEGTRRLLGELQDAGGRCLSDLLARHDEDGQSFAHFAAVGGSAAVMTALRHAGASLEVADRNGITPLHVAGRLGHAELVRYLAHEAPSLLTAKASNGADALYTAAQHGQTQIVDILLRCGVRPTAVLTDGMTPLYAAIHHYHEDVARRLIEQGADVNSSLEDEAAPIHMAAQLGFDSVVAALLARGVDPNLAQRDGMTPLHLAASHGHTDVCRRLLALRDGGGRRIVDANAPLASGFTPLHVAAAEGQADAIEQLLANGAKADATARSGDTPLMTALRHGQVGSAMRLLNQSPVGHTNEHAETALMLAVQFGFFDLADRLIESGADASYTVAGSGWNIAHYLCRNGQTARLEHYVAHRRIARRALAAADSMGRTPYSVALAGDQRAVVDLFHRRGWPADLSADQPMQRIHYAARAGDIAVLRRYLMVEHGDADRVIAAPGSEHDAKNLAYFAAAGGRHRALSLLIDHGAHVDYVAADKRMAVLCAAVESGSQETVGLVIRHAPIEAVNRGFGPRGTVAAQIAARNGDLGMLKFLRAMGANLGNADANGCTALHEAIERGLDEITDYLLEPQQKLVPAVDILHFAAEQGRFEALSKLLKLPIPIDGVDPRSGETPLQRAIRRRHLECVRRLIDAHADVNLVAAQHTPLTLAAAVGAVDIVLHLLARGAAVNAQAGGQTALHWACTQGHLACAAALLAHGADASLPREDGKTCAQLAGDYPEVLALLCGGQEALAATKAELRKALSKGDANHLRRLLERVPARQSFDLAQTESAGSFAQARVASHRPILHYLVLHDLAMQVGNYEPRDLLATDADGNTALHLAALRGGIAVIRQAIAAGLDLRATNHRGETLLHFAATQGHAELIELLLRQGLAVDAADMEGNTALHLAVSGNHEPAVDLLLRNDADPGAMNRQGLSPLLPAIVHGNTALVRRLLATTIDVNVVVTGQRITYLQAAIVAGHIETVMMLLSQGARMDLRGGSDDFPVHVAARTGSIPILSALLAIDPTQIEQRNRLGRTPVHCASEAGKSDAVAFLAERGADVDLVSHVDPSMSRDTDPPDGVTPVLLAAQAGQRQAVEILYEHGAALEHRDAEGAGVLAYSAGRGSQEVLAYLRQFELFYETQGQTLAFARAVAAGDVEGARALLAAGLPSCAALPGGTQGLHLAARCGRARVAKFLLDRGADPSAATLSGTTASTTAIQEAVIGGSLATTRLLLDQGASLSETTDRGKTLLHLAVESRQAAVALYLLLRGIDAGVRDQAGDTALDRAARLGHRELVEALTSFGAACTLPLGGAASAAATAPAEAVDAGCVRVLERGLQMRLQHAADPRLHIAIRLGHREVVDALSQVDDVDAANEAGDTALHICGDAAVMCSLLEHGADPTLRNAAGETPLACACRRGDVECAHLLLSYGASVSSRDNRGQTPLHEAFAAGSQPAFQLLLRHVAASEVDGVGDWSTVVAGGDVQDALHQLAAGVVADKSARLADGRPLLHAAVAHPRMAELLVMWLGYDVNVCDGAGNSALHLAAAGGHVDTVRQLLRSSATNAELANTAGITPVFLALDKRQDEAAAAIVAARPAALNPKVGRQSQLSLALRHKHTHVATGMVRLGLRLNGYGAGSGSELREMVALRRVEILDEYAGTICALQPQPPTAALRALQEALRDAIDKGLADVVGVLAKYPAIAQGRHDGRLLCAHAVATGNVGVVAAFLEKARGPESVIDNADFRRSPLYLAVNSRDPSLRRLVVSDLCKRASPQDPGEACRRLKQAIADGDMRALYRLLQAGLDICALSDGGASALSQALRETSRGAPERATPEAAVDPDRQQIVSNLLALGARAVDTVRPEQQSALDHVLQGHGQRWLAPICRAGVAELARVGVVHARPQLLRACAAPSNSALLAAAMDAGNADLVDWLVRHGAQVFASAPESAQSLSEIGQQHSVPAVAAVFARHDRGAARRAAALLGGSVREAAAKARTLVSAVHRLATTDIDAATWLIDQYYRAKIIEAGRPVAQKAAKIAPAIERLTNHRDEVRRAFERTRFAGTLAPPTQDAAAPAARGIGWGQWFRAHLLGETP